MAISNTLTGLMGSLYSAVNIVGRELVGLANSVSINADAARVAKGESVTVPASRVNTTGDIAPAMNPPEPGNRTVDGIPITISKAKFSAFGFTGEDTLGLSTGTGINSVQVQEIAQAIRALTNEIESDLAGLYVKASRAYGTAGTTPFATSIADMNQVRKILADNGAPVAGGWNAALDTTAGTAMRNLTQLTDVNRAGESSFLRQGTILPVSNGLAKESGQIKTHTKGTGTGYQTNSASLAVGDTTVAIDTGSGTVVAGDVVTFAGDANKYVVTTGVAAAGNLVIAEPGLRTAVADNAAMTIHNNFTANMAFTPDAIQLAVRRPAMPEGGDLAEETAMIVDPYSGLLYEFARYKGYRQNRYEVCAAWGFEMTKPEHAAILLG